jgi:hypothetical protein
MRSELDNKGWTHMSPSGKKKTTMAKLTRESKLRERRAEKQVRKDARKLAAAARAGHRDPLGATGQPAVYPTVEPPAEA